MNFMSQGKQMWTPFPSSAPYDEIVFPPDNHVKEGAPNCWSHKFYDGSERTLQSIANSIDPSDEELKSRIRNFFDICIDVHNGFVALGIYRLLPSWLKFLVKDKVDRLYRYGSMTVRDAQHAVLSLGYSKDELLKNCPKVGDKCS